MSLDYDILLLALLDANRQLEMLKKRYEDLQSMAEREHNQLRSQLLLSDKLATLGTLSAGIVHEVNNPLAFIIENLHSLKEQLKVIENDIGSDLNTNGIHFHSSHDIHHFLQQLNQKLIGIQEIVGDSIHGAETIRDIVCNLKGFARINDEVASSVDIHDILQAAIKIAKPEIKLHTRLVTEFTSIPKTFLQFSKLQQVFLNLIMNAVQAMHNNKRQDNTLSIKTSLQDNFICIAFSDTGSGIPTDILPNIFDPFFTTKPIGLGTGLGLSICYEIIRNIGGEIKVSTKEGQGSTFAVYIPLQNAKENIREELSIETSGLRILVIDDEPTLLKTLQRILEPKHKVTTVGDARIAIDLLQKNIEAFDVIITDLHMPQVTGIDIYHFLAENYPGREERIIFITGGSSDNAQQRRFIAEVKNPILEKPFTKELLLRTVDKLKQISEIA